MTQSEETLVLGIDLGGTKILTAVVNSEGKMLSCDHSITPAREGEAAIVKSILESADYALSQAGISLAKLSAIGLGAPGLSNPDTGILFTSPHLPGLRDVPLRSLIEKELGKKTYLINDANAAAFGELRFGAARNANNYVYVTVSTGIGGGIIIDGKIYAGSAGMAGEVGHMVIDDEGPSCPCGNRGCWETLASGSALAREAKQQIRSEMQTFILEFADGDVEKVTAEAIHQAARAGDELARKLIMRTGYYLGVGLANLINIFNPEVIVIGGGLANIGDMLLQPAYAEAERRAFRQAYQMVRFTRSGLGLNSGVIGAAVYALDMMGNNRSNFRISGIHK